MVQGVVMLLGYNTNGLADHNLPSAIELVAELGYQSIAITLDHHTLNPFGDRLQEEIDQIKRLIDRHQLTVVIETGARYLLDHRRKHQPTLVSPSEEERQRRIDFLCRAIDIATWFPAHAVSLWSGVAVDETSHEQLMDRLAQSLAKVLEHAHTCGVDLAFEPEPGHVVDTMERYGELQDRLPPLGWSAEELGLTIDIGHLHCQGETPIADVLRRWSGPLRNVHIEDMRAGVHEHLMFGDGEIDFPPVFAALQEIGYTGPITVELPRHSHIGPMVAEQSLRCLRSWHSG